jgi:hypothetical protein
MRFGRQRLDLVTMSGRDLKRIEDRSIDGSAGRTAYGGVNRWGLSAGCAADLSIVGEV